LHYFANHKLLLFDMCFSIIQIIEEIIALQKASFELDKLHIHITSLAFSTNPTTS